MARLRPALTLLLLLLTALALHPGAAEAQGDPAAAYRAWWASGLTAADPGSERFRSRASLEELAAFRSEDPATAAEALAFMAEAHRELVEAATLGRIEVVEEENDVVVLHVVLEGRAGPLPRGLPSEASVRMVRETDGWKVDTESFRGSILSGGSGASGEGEESCPVDASLGNPASPHRLVLHGSDADRTVHPGAAYLLREGDALTLHLPLFQENLLSIEASSGSLEPGSHPAVLVGMRWAGGCPALAEALVHDDAPRGTLTWGPADDPASVRVSFSFADPGSGTSLLSGSLQDIPLLDVSPAPMGAGSTMVTIGGEEITPDRGRVLLYEGEARLEIMLEYSLPNGGGSTTISVPEFRGKPGVQLGRSWFDTREVTVVRVFQGERIELEVREVPEDALPEGALDADAALGLGTLKARVVTDRVVRIPALPPVEG